MDKNPSITCIGSGNVATIILAALHDKGVTIRQVISRNPDHARLLAQKVHSERYSHRLEDMDDRSEFYLIAVRDDDIKNVLEAFPFCFTDTQVLLHTSGTFDDEVLSGYAKHIGSLYPLQTLRKDSISDLSETPFLIHANTESAIEKTLGLARLMSNRIQIYDQHKRKQLHVAAVLSNNFTNHILALAKKYCQSRNLDFELLWPLIEEGIRKAKMSGPENAQTGPAIRGDFQTISQHEKALELDPDLLNIYNILTRSIQKMYTES